MLSRVSSAFLQIRPLAQEKLSRDLLTDKLKHHADKNKKDKGAQLVASQPLPGTNVQTAVARPPPPLPPSPQKKAKQPSPKKGVFQVCLALHCLGAGLAS